MPFRVSHRMAHVSMDTRSHNGSIYIMEKVAGNVPRERLFRGNLPAHLTFPNANRQQSLERWHAEHIGDFMGVCLCKRGFKHLLRLRCQMNGHPFLHMETSEYCYISHWRVCMYGRGKVHFFKRNRALIKLSLQLYPPLISLTYFFYERLHV